MLNSLAHRERIPERMDQPDLDPAEHRAALAGLSRINRFSRSAAILWPAIRALAERRNGNPIRILDVATGSGDLPFALWKKARKHGIPLIMEGCDISPIAVQAATENAGGSGIRFFEHDLLRDPLPEGYDLVMCSLFLHHLAEADAITVLKRMKDATRDLLVVNDLHRSRLSFVLVWIGCHVLSRSPIVRFDGPASVRSAFTSAEAVAIAERAGLAGATCVHRWPCRYLLTWRRDGSE